MKKTTILIMLLILISGITFSQNINVNDPATGVKWIKGQGYQINWTFKGKINPYVKIRLFNQAGLKVLAITNTTPNKGSFFWKIPGTIPTGNYKIRIKTLDNLVFGESGLFSIADPIPIQVPTLTVNSPHTGDSWEKGKTYSITWKKTGTQDANVKIRLFQGGVKVLNIINSTINNGSFSWQVPQSVSAGNYVIRVKTVDNKIFDNSDSFLIKDAIVGSIIQPSSIFVDDPKLNVLWEKGKSYDINWTSLGNVINSVKITLNDTMGKIVKYTISPTTSNSGKFKWTIPSSVQDGNYRVVVMTTDNKISGKSPVFTIKKASNNSGFKVLQVTRLPLNTVYNNIKINKNIVSLMKDVTFYSPKSGYIWKPLNDYEVTFEVSKSANPKKLHLYLNVTLLPEDSSKSIGLFFLKEQLDKYVKETKSGYIYSFKWRFLGSYNIPSGKYKVKVKSSSYNIKGESEVFSVENNISNNTAFLGEDKPDLIIEDVYFDYFPRMIKVRIRNNGFSPYKGDIQVGYTFENKSQRTFNDKNCNSTPISGKKQFKNVSIGKYQIKEFDLVTYRCFDKRPGDFIPRMGPMNYDVWVHDKGKYISRKSGLVCKTKKSDILAPSSLHLYNKDGRFSYVSGNSTISPSNFNWTRGTFRTKIGVKVWNWGCSTRTFKINLFMDGPYLNGKKGITVGTITLKPGEQRYFTSNLITFSIPQDSKYRRLLLVADQPEKSNEGYPNSYMNNFILGNIRIYYEDNTIHGVVNW